MPRPAPPKLNLRPLLRPGDGVHYGAAQFDASVDVRLHGHRFHEIFWIESGEGVEFTPRRRWPLATGDIVFVRPPDVHGFAGAAGCAPLMLRNVAFPSAAWAALRRRYGRTLADPFAGGLARRRMQVPHLIGLLSDAATDLRQGRLSPLDRDRFLLRLDQILRDAPASPPPAWLAAALTRLATPAMLAEGVAAFVRLAGRSHEHVARACRRHLDRTPTQIVNDARLDAAATLLSTTDRPVLDVGLDCGFGHAGHFHASFRRRFGVTPRTYRIGHRATTLG